MQLITFYSYIDMPNGEELDVVVTAQIYRERVVSPSHHTFVRAWAKIDTVEGDESGDAIIPDDDSLYRLEGEALDYV